MSQRFTSLREGAVPLLALVALLLMTACALPGGAAQATPTPNPRAAGLDYSRCMRSHGVPNFPDPDSNGGISIGTESGIDPNTPQYKAADKACASKLRAGQSSPPALDRTKLLEYSRCMRAHGEPNFPDPRSNGGIELNGNVIDTNSPQFKAADKACKKHLPGGGRGGSTTTSGGS